ncbi:putative quinone oxidoreductase [Colletotrichum gloeosporioides]|uniref:Probable quinone oxidoreductase n=1 Tax=Colletotrichum gloeosporioides TaxID=474922 RepID=A0A8H4FK41_COLGL|nr:putative quinone oxidoreductase [Colletotrichum gloeosporioides]KAF3803854.1 putative quinone oxidoreductase [Colletotrichum gloeosporioides]
MSLIPSPPRTFPKLTRCLLSASASHSPLSRQHRPLISQHLTRKLNPSRTFTTSPARLIDLSPAPHFTMASTPSVPKTMNGIQIPRTGDVSVLTHETALPVPTPSEGQVLVRNEYAGINYIDTYFRTGLYKAPLPQVLGREGAGTVVSAHPSVSTFAPGDRVVYMGPFSSYATYSAVPASSLLRIPDALGTDTAAAALLQGLTAWTFIREAGVVQKGEWVLVHAAAGGVGLQLVQMLRAVGAKVIGTTSSDEKCALAKKNGAEWIVNSKSQDLVTEVKKITDGHGVDVIFDGVGKATFDSDLEMAARKGRLVIFGNASGAVPPFDILKLGPKNLKVMRPVVNNYVATREELEKYSSELFEMITSGKVEVAIHKAYPLKDVKQAHTDLESRNTTGKLLLKID